MSSWIVWALFSAVATAATGILTKVGLEKVDSKLGLAIQSVVILILSWAIVARSGQATRLLDIAPKSWGFLLGAGVMTTIGYLCYFHALEAGDAARVAPIDRLSLVFGVIFAAILLKEKVNAIGIAGVALMGCGALLVALSGGK